MFIAHLPAGYLLSDRLSQNRSNRRSLMAVGLFASGLPDFDLLWFYFVDGRNTPHHAFVFHWPLFWIGLAATAWILARLLHWRSAEPYIFVALACLLLHMVLDSVAAEIHWLKPFSDFQLNLVKVPAGYSWWVWNFILHWTFIVELAITFAAAWMLWRNLTRQDIAAAAPAR
ncbi:metal-dependent hydrolase [Hyphomicrobium sulfonivorans]|uniref:metal-dependent hydrolase n=1 Tax=Hyphomicrobium sulfonivorans TaxID=121290 RepID=UPI00156E8BF5|nr:metal-dependent hydrolase [Hyphomicrobium sulfonivorans]MBI1650545.1 metal-dependent hydrolase [Hyphomicrobium sulfonivorans]NSL72097.1 hypothetical protein [Hyphomicrobium sulfonivorans]